MKFSESWLRQWVNPNESTQQLIEKLTMAGLEVDAVEPASGAFTGVLVGEIISIEQHPDADKLRVCQVAGHPEGIKQVVCGAANARAGIKVPFATVGAVLPPSEDGKPFKIKKAKLRGVESLGMLCGQTELKVGDDDSGLFELPSDAPVGHDFRAYLELDDNIIEVDLTPNRSDCLSIAGLAREVGVLYKLPVTHRPLSNLNIASPKTLNTCVSATKACPKYTCRVIEGIDNSVPTPVWLKEKLRRSGIRSIDAVVDVTNYVLMELGQPMHAFDLSTLNGEIDVRFANDSEKLTLLNDQSVDLTPDTLVISDGSGAVAMAGVMGGSSTAVTSKTQSILLESAYFDPVSIAGKARNYGLHTDSSHRFERGVDYNNVEFALDRATELLLDIVGGSAGEVISSISQENLPQTKTVALKKAKIQSGLGFAINENEVEDILTRLGLKLINRDNEGWQFEIPSYRFDISIEADLLEELARIYGYNNLPTTTLTLSASLPQRSESVVDVDTLKDHLASRDYQEAITYSFIDPGMHKLLFGDTKAVEVLNPISQDMSLMRTSLLPGMLQALTKNTNKQTHRVRLFETGLRFVPGDNYSCDTLSDLAQVETLGAIIYGTRSMSDWHQQKDYVDFFDLKGDLESLLKLTTEKLTFEPVANIAHLHPGQSANVFLAQKNIGYIGALHPSIVKKLGLNHAAYVFELDLQPILKTSKPHFSDISKHPEVTRDLAFTVDKKINSAQLDKEIRCKAGDYLKQLKVFDLYSGKGIDSERKSIAFNLIFQHGSRTLTEEEINAPMDAIVQHLKKTFDAQLR